MRRRLANWFGRKIASLVRSAEKDLDQDALPAFRNSPENLHIEQPHRLINPSHMTIGDDVSLGPGCMINAIRRYPGPFMSGKPEGIEPQEFQPEISIGNRVSATGYLTIGACSSVTIEDDVLIASHVFISDNSHGRSRTDVPYKFQHLEQIAPVTIGRASWIGEHAVIMPGVSIGEYAIVGANSVVTRDVPPRSIVAGAPARVIRRWNDELRCWQPVDS
jgi:acetyltransferase-like isoleucine patch superfamily enzyme